MSFNYNDAISKANTIRNYAQQLLSSKNDIASVAGTINDYWKRNDITQIENLISTSEGDIVSVYNELNSIAAQIETAANSIRQQEYEQEQKRIREEKARQQQIIDKRNENNIKKEQQRKIYVDEIEKLEVKIKKLYSNKANKKILMNLQSQLKELQNALKNI